jgi:hypothetical protein
MMNEHKLNDVAPLVDEWIRSRGTSMDGNAYAAALDLAAHVKSDLEQAPVSWQSVIDAINAVDTESTRRGEMFPQTSDEQREDRRAVRRVCETIRWYATKGGTGIESFVGWPSVAAPAATPMHDGAAIQLPYNVGQAKAWIAVCRVLSKVAPDWDEGMETGTDKAVAAIRRLAASAAPAQPEESATAGMTLAERIAHVGGRENTAGYIEFGSVMAVDALIQHALRDAPVAPAAAQAPKTISAQEALAAIDDFEIVGDNNDSRDPTDEDRFILSEFIAHAFGGYHAAPVAPGAAPQPDHIVDERKLAHPHESVLALKDRTIAFLRDQNRRIIEAAESIRSAAAAKAGATLPPMPDPSELLEIARATGLRSFLFGVNATDARAILETYQVAVDARRASLPTGEAQ